MITIRHATLADEETIAVFNERLAEESEAKRLDPDTLRRGVRAALADATRARYFLAEVDGRVVGQVMLTFEWSDWRDGWIWWIQSVYVVADHRRRGVFRRLFEHVRSEAEAAADVVGLRLYVERHNAAARATYRRLGLVEGGYLVMERFHRRDATRIDDARDPRTPG